VKSLSGSRTYEKEQVMQQSQKTASFLNKTRMKNKDEEIDEHHRTTIRPAIKILNKANSLLHSLL